VKDSYFESDILKEIRNTEFSDSLEMAKRI